MNQYSDAALLKGKFAHMNRELRAGRAEAETKVDWKKASCANAAEEAAQEVAKHIFAFSQSLDPEAERMEVLAFSAAGPMKVMGVVPGEGDLLRVDGVAAQGNMPTSVVMHANQLSLTFVRRPIAELKEEEDGMQIGFVIFDELQERENERKKKKKQAE